MVDVVAPALAIRSSVGIELWASSGNKAPYEYKSNLPQEKTKNSRSISFSPEGRYFAYANGQEVKVLRTNDWQLHCTLQRPKAFYLKFSPRGNFLCTWELYTVTKEKQEGSPNMFVYDLATGAEVFAIVQKKQTDWEPSWSTDETIFAIVVGGEALFYNLEEGASNGFKSPVRKIGGSRGGVLSLGPGNSPPFLAFYVPGNKDSPSMCKLYKYPALSQNQSVACKSFFQADRIEMLWNKRGTGLLLLTSTEVDKSGASYYGNQALHFMNTKGDSFSVPLSKEGPVHCVKWNPKNAEFLVIYGMMPSKAAMFNSKCDVTFDFGEGPHNCAYFNAFGNLVVLAGFGNLPGNIEVWDVVKKERLASIKVPDTTYFEWHPNGEYFITATTAPRLRIGNGFKVYHYSGALMHETIWPQGQELLGVEWQQFPENTFAEPAITKIKKEGIKSSQPEASKKAYTPPHLRLMKEGKDPGQYLPQPKASIPGLSTGSTAKTNNNRRNSGAGASGNAKFNNQKSKMKSRKENICENATSNDAAKTSASEGAVSIADANAIIGNARYQSEFRSGSGHHIRAGKDSSTTLTENREGQYEQSQQSPSSQAPKAKASNPDKEKKIRSVAKKLSDIKKLKIRQDQGETLEQNQLNKISQESRFLDELKALKMSA